MADYFIIASCRSSRHADATADELTKQLKKIGVELEVLREDQAEYIGVQVEGPYKPEYYRY